MLCESLVEPLVILRDFSSLEATEHFFKILIFENENFEILSFGFIEQTCNSKLLKNTHIDWKNCQRPLTLLTLSVHSKFWDTKFYSKNRPKILDQGVPDRNF